jgi:hypothetical protein
MTQIQPKNKKKAQDQAKEDYRLPKKQAITIKEKGKKTKF